MGLPRTFVGFSSTDINYYRTMLMWKAHDHIDFDFCDVQLQDALNSTNEQYIKQRCRERLDMAGTYILLIGQDTRYKHQYVLWETEVAIEKKVQTDRRQHRQLALYEPRYLPFSIPTCGCPVRAIFLSDRRTYDRTVYTAEAL